MISFISKVVIVLNFVLNIQSQDCQTIVTRPEFRSLTHEHRSRYLKAVKQLHTTGFGLKHDEYTKIHLESTPVAHGVPAFFPWHREFIRQYELELQQIDSSIILPYWDWTIDSQDPEESLLLTDEYFGGDGQDNNCIYSKIFGNLQLNVPYPHCLRRDFNSKDKISSFYSPEAIEALLSESKSYESFRNNIESGPHGSVHNGIGGTNGDFSTMHSPNDPLFFLHHAFIDLLWSEWQQRNPSLVNDYTGSIDDVLIPFNIPVSRLFNNQAPGYCYTYPRYSAKLPIIVNSLRRRDNSTKPLVNLVNYYSSYVNNPVKIDYLDRTTKHKIRTPKPLPENYIKNRNLNLQQVRQVESPLAKLVQSLNNYPGFTPAARIHQ